LTQIGLATAPRLPSRVRVTRCRTLVPMVFARATRYHLSTAIFTPRQRSPNPDAYGAE
jgi:hypothetical protein